VRKPLTGRYRGYDIVTFPPPSSGGVALIESLNMLELFSVKMDQPQSMREYHLLLEVMRRAFADRSKYLGDPDFVHVPVQGLTNPRYAKQRMTNFEIERASGNGTIALSDPTLYDTPDTTHFTIVDQQGNVVTNTYTLNDEFGSGATVTGTGILLNDEMDDFAAKAGVPNGMQLVTGHKNLIAPKKRPVSSMTPTIVLKDGKLWFALGSPGGAKIISSVLQVVVNVIDFGMNIQDAVDAPRIHHQFLPDEVYWELVNFDQATREGLEKMGYTFRAKPELLGDVEVVMVDPKTGKRLGAADHRRGGTAVGW
jgi:gamma-glutamyltranspeptidase/glutathione hydrolase